VNSLRLKGGTVSPRRSLAVPALATVGLLAAGSASLTTPAVEADSPSIFTADHAVARDCAAGPRVGERGLQTTDYTAPRSGLLTLRLAGTGDWDVAVFDAREKSLVAAAAGFRSNEVAQGHVTKGQQLLIQACRYAGSTRSVRYTTSVSPAPEPGGTAGQLLTVHTPTAAAKRTLQDLDLDLAEAGTSATVDMVSHGPGDLERLRHAGLTWTVRVADLRQQAREREVADSAYAGRVAASPLPSGRTSYRRLADYQYEMKELARAYPDLVRPLTLAHQSVERRDLEALEITSHAAQVEDGKPVLVMMGLHHAREWPSGEHTLEWAYDLLTKYGKDAKTTRLVEATRTIVLPVVNPDGFTVSRDSGDGGGWGSYEMKRKNCQAADAPARFQGGTCAANTGGPTRGTDLNRNYGGFWGGPGASGSWSSETFRGSAPFSEPEVRAVRDLVSQRQVTTLLSNHTYSNLILRPPGLRSQRLPAEEPMYKALADKMATFNGYRSQHGWELYDTTGTTEDWSFWNTGGLAFTFEIGGQDFHPAYESGVVSEYLGKGRGGNQAAYYTLLEATADASHHSVLTGTAPKGSRLTLRKEFQTATLAGAGTAPTFYTDVLESSLTAPGGTFTWHTNPSTRPYVAGKTGTPPTAGVKESWTLTCQRPGGQITAVRQVIVDRGQTLDLGDACR
jgi:hypothetical protein